jgi:hypothetical protein
MDARFGFILASLLVVVTTYLLLSRREGNYINILFPFILINVPAYFLFELVFLVVLEAEGSVYAYFYCYATYAAGVVAVAVAYTAMPGRWVPIFVKLPRLRIPGVPWLILLMGGALYAPVLIEYSHLIFQPREIYMATRTGFGIQFFLSTFLAYFALILMLFAKSVPRTVMAVFVSLVLLLIYLHGSKGQLLVVLMISLYFVVFIRGWRFRLGALMGLGSAAGLVMGVLFYITLPASMKEDLLVGIVSYSDYTRHAAVVIDDPHLEPQLGRLTAESSLYTVIPRALFPDKPRDFGSFWLAKRYYPEWFEANTGAPAFGIGVQYADFGGFTIAWDIFTHLLLGGALKILVTRLRQKPDPGSFILLLALLDVALIPAGSAVPLIIYYVLAHAANVLAPEPKRSQRRPDVLPAGLPA